MHVRLMQIIMPIVTENPTKYVAAKKYIELGLSTPVIKPNGVI